MVKDRQVRKLWRLLSDGKSLASAARSTDMDSKTARKYRDSKELPSDGQEKRNWRTREDSFAEVWPEVQAQLERAPRLQAFALFEWLREQHPGQFPDSRRRTFERRVRAWCGSHGPAREVMFPQVHRPGDLAASDFTCMNGSRITISRQPFDHMLYHCTLTYSNWEFVRVCFSESFEAVSRGLQEAFWELGGVPRRHRTDSLSAAVNNLSEDKEFRGRYRDLLDYYRVSERRVASRAPRKKRARTRQLVDSLSGPELVIKELRYLCMTGYDLTASHNIHRDRSLYEASRRHFGSWNQALAAAGVNLENIRLPTKPRLFNREELIEALRQRKQNGQTLVWRLVCFENRLFTTAVKCAFGSWKRAMNAAGLALDCEYRPASRWDLPQILDAIHRLQQEGKSMKCSHIRKEHGALVSAARRFFATWDEALMAATRSVQ